MKENKEKENPNPSRMRGRGVEVSKTLFYCRGTKISRKCEKKLYFLIFYMGDGIMII